MNGMTAGMIVSTVFSVPVAVGKNESDAGNLPPRTSSVKALLPRLESMMSGKA